MDPINDSVRKSFFRAANREATDSGRKLIVNLSWLAHMDACQGSFAELIDAVRTVKQEGMHHDVEKVVHWLIAKVFKHVCPRVMIDLMAEAQGKVLWKDLELMAQKSMDFATYPRAVAERHSARRNLTDGPKWRDLLKMPPDELMAMFALRGIDHEREPDWIKEKLRERIFSSSDEPPAKVQS